MGRLFCWALVAFGAVSVFGQGGNFPQTTLVQDVLYRADGTPATGTLVISWPAFVTADGAAVAAGMKPVALGNDGSFSVALAPNAGAVPAGTYYSVTVKLDGATTSKEAWVVSASSPAKVSTVRAEVVPATMAMQALTVDWANANLVDLTGVQSVTGVKNFGVSPTAPDPVNATDVANKEYVDRSAGIGGAAFTVGSGCGAVSGVTGGATAGSFVAGQSSCSPVIAFAMVAAHGWACAASDITHPLVMAQMGTSATSCTVTGSATSGDTIVFSAKAY